MRKNRNFYESITYAVSGLVSAVKRERNLRFHLFSGLLVCIFAYFYELTRAEWAVLFLTIGSVIVCELINTAIENAVDSATQNYSVFAKAAKDIAAAAVMVAAIIAVCVGFVLFWDFSKLLFAMQKAAANPVAIALAVFCVMAGLLFLIFGGKNEK
jgi:diacylglycerol kinase